MTNAERATAFLAMAARGEVQAAYEAFVDPSFIHHNQYFKGDRQSLLDAMLAAHKTSPNTSFEVKKVYEAGETVITHSLVTRSTEPKEIVVVHILRFAAGKIVELWDVGVPVVGDGPNENGVI
ncbi:MAG: nuclear transport factor 2 family protein [Proteobacteria bacterium]|nr:nuclear transport factor 2 family protein [Pseudomonadota bacterium]